MIDIHSHIIPGIDDGSKNIDITIEMLKNAANDGISSIVATPHFCFDYGKATITEVKQYVEKLNLLVQKENINIKIFSGQEVYFYEGMIADYKNGITGTINDSRYMLIEFPMDKFPENAFDVLYELKIKNIVPIIAHVERYRYIVDDPSFINRMIDEEYLFQLNAGSIEGKFGSSIQKTAEMLLENGIYSFIGSDAHGVGRRCTGLKTALDICKDIDENSVEIFLVNSEKLLDNKEIEFTGRKIEKKKKGLFSFFRR